MIIQLDKQNLKKSFAEFLNVEEHAIIVENHIFQIVNTGVYTKYDKNVFYFGGFEGIGVAVELKFNGNTVRTTSENAEEFKKNMWLFDTLQRTVAGTINLTFMGYKVTIQK